ncbi:MAG TPA: 3'-5' exonuclease [Thermomicrobiales bacterium]|jgi:DNA polymerase elongation subunit (family B)|nr:3'-5' exonuclease [Thermomicrobiales bacterium]
MTIIPADRDDSTHSFDDIRRERLLYGHDPLDRIVAVERVGPDRMALYLATETGERKVRYETFRPWLLATRAEPWSAIRPVPEIVRLSGDHDHQYLIRFANWNDHLDAVQAAKRTNEPYFRIRPAVEQYLVGAGRTLFRGMDFPDLRRVQLDIETLGLDPTVDDAAVIAIAIRTQDGDETFMINEGSEPDLINRLTEWILKRDPDVVEGHNIFNFDLPFLVTRAERYGMSLPWGRNGSQVLVREGSSRFKVAALSLPFTWVHIHGRHVIDTYQQIQRYDIGGKLGSYALKKVMASLYPEQEREIIPGEEIRGVWERGELTRLERYNLADVRDVDTLSRLTLPTEFYQTQIVPRSFQSVATGGTGEKINDILVRAYLADGHSIPNSAPAVPYPGGHAELIRAGAFTPVVKCDVESLYPSIMLGERIRAKSDNLDAALPMLAELTRRRLEAKAKVRTAPAEEQLIWNGLQGSFKILINSFYGYLGYSGGLFNDYDAATRVTVVGQELIKRVVLELEATGSIPIEVDTDGVYFVPPDDVRGEEAEMAYVARIGEALPAGIRLAHDGGYAGMLSLKLKNYALLEADGSLIMKGSSLRSRQLERCFRDFLSESAMAFIEGRSEDVKHSYFALAERIRARDLPVAAFSQWRMLNAETVAKTPRLQQLLQEHSVDARTGERVELYERQDGKLGLAEHYNEDESTPYLLRRLRDTAERFRPLFNDDRQFEAMFPAISARTNLDAARQQEARSQLSLF